MDFRFKTIKALKQHNLYKFDFFLSIYSTPEEFGVATKAVKSSAV
ncbi:MAG: hypothetical protein WD876_00225 [Candidatus Pacearchaeota archaeon]